jgi:UDP-N-acetylglucosamine--N-acetylmuramyl-(pentapeptide) pyrophosphoryl-undecaprenol N-acetylglucosamine transferase
VVVVFAGGGTGGHLYPALALAEALVRIRPDVRPVFVGAERGIEARILPDRGVEHHLVPVRGLRRDRLLANVGILAELARSIGRVRALFRRLAPELVVVTGGYAAAPAGLAARLSGVPLALQEQNSYPGFTTKRLAAGAAQIHVAFPEAIGLLPAPARDRVVVSGNPIRPPGDVDRSQARESFGLDAGATVLVIVGGSQGSMAINDRVLAAVEGVESGDLERPADLQILWATGPANYAGVTGRLQALGSPAWVKAVDYLHNMPDALASADMAIGRAGAMSTSEFLAWGVPSILVPLPTSAEDHQARNAEALEGAGVSLYLPQQGLTGAGLWDAVVSLAADRPRRDEMSRKARARGRADAADQIARSLATLLPAPEAGRDGGGA